VSGVADVEGLGVGVDAVDDLVAAGGDGGVPAF
jgi:hypothetical protein